MAGRSVSVPWRVSDVVLGSIAVVALTVLVTLALAPAGELPADETFLGIPVVLWAALVMELILAGVAVVFIRRRGGSIRQLGFVSPSGRAPYLLALAAWFVGVVALGIWVLLIDAADIQFLEPPDNTGEILDAAGGMLIPSILVIGLVAPLCEEIFFRGFALAGFARRFGVPIGLGLSAILFGVFHIHIGLIIPTAIFGVVLGWLYVRTGSILPSIAAHAFHNSFALLTVATTAS